MLFKVHSVNKKCLCHFGPTISHSFVLVNEPSFLFLLLALGKISGKLVNNEEKCPKSKVCLRLALDSIITANIFLYVILKIWFVDIFVTLKCCFTSYKWRFPNRYHNSWWEDANKKMWDGPHHRTDKKFQLVSRYIAADSIKTWNFEHKHNEQSGLRKGERAEPKKMFREHSLNLLNLLIDGHLIKWNAFSSVFHFLHCRFPSISISCLSFMEKHTVLVSKLVYHVKQSFCWENHSICSDGRAAFFVLSSLCLSFAWINCSYSKKVELFIFCCLCVDVIPFQPLHAISQCYKLHLMIKYDRIEE